MTSQLSTINRDKILITNGKYCKWGGLPKSWKKHKSTKGTVRYYNSLYNSGIGVIATCPIRGEKREKRVLAGEIFASLEDRTLLSENDDGYILWQVWKGKENGKELNIKVALIKDIGCALDFSLISEFEFEKNELNDFDNAVKNVVCKEDFKWK